MDVGSAANKSRQRSSPTLSCRLTSKQPSFFLVVRSQVPFLSTDSLGRNTQKLKQRNRLRTMFPY